MIRTIRYLFSLIILGALVYYIYLNRDIISMDQMIRHKGTMGASIILLALSYLAGGFGWILILKEMKLEAPAGKALRVWFTSQLGKYIPGKIWGAVSRLYLAPNEGQRIEVGYSIFLEMVLVNITGICVFLFSLILWNPGIPGFGKKYLWFAVMFPLMLILLHPAIMEKMVNRLLKWMKKRPVEIRLRFRQIMGLFLYYIFFWALYAISFGVLVSAFTGADINDILIFSGMYIFAFLVGFLTLISPSGLGVREGVLSLLLSFYMETHTAIYISVISRIWFILVELVMVFFFLILERPRYVKETVLSE